MNERREPFRFAGITPRKIYDQLNQFVVGQERAKEVLAIAAYSHLKRLEAARFNRLRGLRKSNILMIGPSGSGKTYLARTLATLLDVPFAYNDATSFTEAGYYGEDVEVAIGRLLYATGQDIKEAETGIVFIDEIDKIARRTGGARTGAGSRDIGGEGVQQGLLKVIEGEKIFVPLNVTAHWNKYDHVEIDVANILFICAGSFSDLAEMRDAANVGFTGEGGRSQGQGISTERLIAYGMLPELLGRLPVRVELYALTEAELMEILTRPREALIPEYQRLLELDDVNLTFTPDALAAIAKLAVAEKLGARALRGILERIMHRLLFEAPERSGESIVIDRAWVETNTRGK